MVEPSAKLSRITVTGIRVPTAQSSPAQTFGLLSKKSCHATIVCILAGISPISKAILRQRPLLPRDLPIHRKQPYPLHARVMRQVDHVGDILKVDIGVAAHEDYFFGTLQIDFREARF